MRPSTTLVPSVYKLQICCRRSAQTPSTTPCQIPSISRTGGSKLSKHENDETLVRLGLAAQRALSEIHHHHQQQQHHLILLLSAPLALSPSTHSRPAALDVFSNSRAEFLLVAASCAGRRLQSRESVCAILRGSALNLREQQRCFEVHSSCPLWWPALRRDFKLKMPSECEQILPGSSSPSVYNNLAPRPQGAIEKGHH